MNKNDAFYVKYVVMSDPKSLHCDMFVGTDTANPVKSERYVYCVKNALFLETHAIAMMVCNKEYGETVVPVEISYTIKG